jgi:hypothetical protein
MGVVVDEETSCYGHQECVSYTNGERLICRQTRAGGGGRVRQSEVPSLDGEVEDSARSVSCD